MKTGICVTVFLLSIFIQLGLIQNPEKHHEEVGFLPMVGILFTSFLMVVVTYQFMFTMENLN